jgi:hypothetical protein
MTVLVVPRDNTPTWKFHAITDQFQSYSHLNYAIVWNIKQALRTKGRARQDRAADVFAYQEERGMTFRPSTPFQRAPAVVATYGTR